jgi:hypothetical protein
MDQVVKNEKAAKYQVDQFLYLFDKPSLDV